MNNDTKLSCETNMAKNL